MDFYSFPTVRGVQSGREYFVTMCPLRLVPRLFTIEKKIMPPELRAQRVINKSRIPSICSYIVNNPKNYVFPSMVVSIDSEVEFTPFSDDVTHFNLGTLKIPISAKLVINDGQHRRAAIEEALKQNPSLGNESISVVFFIDWGLKHSQQMFADLNRYAVRPNKSISILFDYRDPFSRLTLDIINEIKFFHDYTDLEKTDISSISTKIFALSGIFFATKELLNDKKKLMSEERKKLAVSFWGEVFLNIEEWQQIERNLISPFELRNNFICSHTVALMALGRAGRSLINEYPENWNDHLSKISSMNWHRNNLQWEGRVTIRGKISNSRNNVLLLCNVIKRKLGLNLNEEEQGAESAFVKDEQ